MSVLSDNIQTLLASEALDLLTQLMRIDSQTKNIAGVNQAQDLLIDFLAPLGFQQERLPHHRGDYGDLLVLKREVSPKAKTLTFIFHVDTVLPPRSGEPFYLCPMTKNLIGQGVADCKGGIVIALLAIKKFLETSKDQLNLQVISSPNEEVGSVGFLDICSDLGKQSDYLLGFEPSLPDGSVISSRNGNRWYNIEVEGRSAHAGRANGEEINAAHDLALKIAEILKLKDKFPKAKLNIGSLEGGTGQYNIVCGQASAKLDTRFEDHSTRNQLHHHIAKILETPMVRDRDGEPAKCRFHIDDDCPPMEFKPPVKPLADHFVELIRSIEKRDIEHRHATGAADINHMSYPHNLCLDGLGAVGGRLHREDEYIEVDSLMTRSQGVAQLVHLIENGTLSADERKHSNLGVHLC